MTLAGKTFYARRCLVAGRLPAAFRSVKNRFNMEQDLLNHDATFALANGSAFAENHLSLLHKIAVEFGFKEADAHELAEEVFHCDSRDYATNRQDCTPMIRLAKSMVRKCTFLIGCRMFREYPVVNILFPAVEVNFKTSAPPEIPLSFQAVFVLFHSTGFRETEVAQILNISAAEVRKRLARAQKMIIAH